MSTNEAVFAAEEAVNKVIPIQNLIFDKELKEVERDLGTYSQRASHWNDVALALDAAREAVLDARIRLARKG